MTKAKKNRYMCISITNAVFFYFNAYICNSIQISVYRDNCILNTDTVKPVLRDHSGEKAKVVSYSRWSFNTGSTIQLKNNVVIHRCYSTTIESLIININLFY